VYRSQDPSGNDTDPEHCFEPQELSRTYFSGCWYLYAEYGVDLPDEAEPDRLLGEARRKSVAVILLLHRLVQIKTLYLPDQYNRGYYRYPVSLHILILTSSPVHRQNLWVAVFRIRIKALLYHSLFNFSIFLFLPDSPNPDPGFAMTMKV